VLEGDLTDFTLPDVLRLLAFTGKTGRLTIEADGTCGRLDLRAGRVREVSADASRLPLARRLLGLGVLGGGALSELLEAREVLPTDLELARDVVSGGSAEAVVLAPLLVEQTTDAAFDLFRWSAGSFRFTGASEIEEAEELEPALAIDELVDAVTERLEAWSDLVQRTGPLDAVVTITRPDAEAAGGTGVALGAEGWGLLALVDGRRTVADLVSLSGQGEYATRRILASLRDAGVVTVGEAEESGPIEQLLADHRSLADLERSLGGGASTWGPERRRRTTSLRTPDVGLPPPDAAPETATSPSPAVPAPVATPAPVVSPALTAAPVPVPAATRVPAATSSGLSSSPGRVRQLRTTVRDERLRTDPAVDADLVDRLIEGVEAL
jgi:hypothetical protein